MQIYRIDYYLYSFDRQKVFRARYLVEYSLVSQEYEKHDKNNIQHRYNVMSKNK